VLEQLKRLAAHSSVYGASNVLAASISLILLPILTRYLSPGEYGALELVIVSAAQLVGVIQLGLGYAVFKAVLRDANDSDSRGCAITTAYVTVAAFGLVVSGGLLLFSDSLAGVLLGDARARTAVRWMLAKAFFEALAVVPMARLRVREESAKYGALNVGRLLFSLTAIAAVLAVFDGGLRAVIAVLAVESALFALAATATARKDLGYAYSSTALRGMLSFGLPLVPLSLGLTVLALGDRYLLRYFTTLDDVGRYAVGYKIAAALGVLIRAFQVAWPPILFSSAERPEASRFYARVLTYVVFILSVAGLAISVFARELVALLAGAQFSGAYVVVPFLALGQLGLAAYYATAVGTNLTGKTYYQTFAALAAIAVLIGLGGLLIPPFGIIGAAIATASGYATLAVVNCAISLHLYVVRYEWRRIALIVISAIGLAAAGFLVDSGSVLADGMLRVAIIAAYPALLYVTRVPTSSERQVLRRLPSVLSRRPDNRSEAVRAIGAELRSS
jgi:O-antigen/teichoic acid export membrane protein